MYFYLYFYYLLYCICYLTDNYDFIDNNAQVYNYLFILHYFHLYDPLKDPNA